MIRLSIVEHLSFQKNIPGKSGQPFNLAKIAIFCVADNNLIIKEIAIFRGATFATTKTIILLTIIQLNATTHHHSAPLCENDYLTLTKTEKSSNFVLANIQGYGIESHHPLDDIVN